MHCIPAFFIQAFAGLAGGGGGGMHFIFFTLGLAGGGGGSGWDFITTTLGGAGGGGGGPVCLFSCALARMPRLQKAGSSKMRAYFINMVLNVMQ